MKINALSVAKFAVSAVVGIGTGKIVEKAIKNIVTPEKLLDKVGVTAATWVISAMAAEATKKYTDAMVDDAVEAVMTIVRDYKNNQKLNLINAGLSTFEQEGLDQARFRRNESGHWVPISQEEYDDIWGKTLDRGNLDPNDVIEILKSGEWQYSATDGSWKSKNKQGKTLSTIHQIRRPDGSVKWVMNDAD